MDPKNFAMGLIGFGKDIKKRLLEATSSFVFSAQKEWSIIRFLKRIACDNGKIGAYAKRMDDPNDTATRTGTTGYSGWSAARPAYEPRS
jgi:hypothetical protein